MSERFLIVGSLLRNEELLKYKREIEKEMIYHILSTMTLKDIRNVKIRL